MNFEAFVKEIEAQQWKVFGVEVYEDGELVHSYGDTTDNRYPIYSATKTIVSIAVGLAVNEGKMNIEDSMLCYLPESAVCSMSETQQEVYRQITVKQLLTMSVQGYPFRAEGESWLRYSLNLPLYNVEQKGFDYSNISAYLVGVAVSVAVGEDFYTYLDRKLFQPLGIIAPPYERCPEGYFYGASKMQLTVNELSRIGLLLYRKGMYKGQRILSEAYVEEATAVQQMNREGGYGYFIWKYRDGFSINGKWGQKCYVLPESGRIITFLGHLEEHSGAVRECMERYLLDEGGCIE